MAAATVVWRYPCSSLAPGAPLVRAPLLRATPRAAPQKDSWCAKIGASPPWRGARREAGRGAGRGAVGSFLGEMLVISPWLGDGRERGAGGLWRRVSGLLLLLGL